MTNQVTATPKKERRAVKNYNSRKRDTPISPEMIPFAEAHKILQHLPGYHSREQMRVRILEDNSLPYQRLGKRGRIWIHGPSVHEKVGAKKGAPEETEDQRLIRHYREKEEHNYITATEAGLASTLAHAKRVWDQYQLAKNDPLILAVAAKKIHEQQIAKPETRCDVCDRAEKLARDDDARIIKAITDGRDALETNEEAALTEFQGLRCPSCWHWRAHAPITLMRARLHPNANVSPTAPLISAASSDVKPEKS